MYGPTESGIDSRGNFYHTNWSVYDYGGKLFFGNNSDIRELQSPHINFPFNI